MLTFRALALRRSDSFVSKHLVSTPVKFRPSSRSRNIPLYGGSGKERLWIVPANFLWGLVLWLFLAFGLVKADFAIENEHRATCDLNS